MPIYSASQLLNKTMFLPKGTRVYSVIDINNLGDKSPVAFNAAAKNPITIDSYLEPTSGYTNSYGIKYAPRKYVYLTFFYSGKYYAVRLNDVGKQSDNLIQQGILNVKEELEKKNKEDNPGIFDDLFSGIGNIFGVTGKTVQNILILLLVILILRYTLPMVLKKK